MAEQIYGLIAKAMNKVGAIGKNSRNEQQKYMFRGIDAVYNALNPVMADLGLFVCPEIIDHRREERETENVYNGQVKKSILKYSILTIKYTIYAPDGSNVSCVVVGEGMDSGDKASNKAMSVALKYAMFQLLMIPTEEMIDPDAETHVVTSPAKTPSAPRSTKQETVKRDAPADVKVSDKLPDAKPKNPVKEYIANELVFMSQMFEIPDKKKMMDKFCEMRNALIESGIIPNVDSDHQTMEQAQQMIKAMYANFKPGEVA